MYRDKTLIPSEAIRLCALGLLAGGERRYSELAGEVRRFASHVLGPSPDLMGTSIELLRYEGLVEPVDGEGMADDAVLRLTDAGREELGTLLASRIRSPLDDVNKLVVALKMRFLHFLDAEGRREQVDILAEATENEIARLEELLASGDGEGLLGEWLAHDIRQLRARLEWFEDLRERV